MDGCLHLTLNLLDLPFRQTTTETIAEHLTAVVTRSSIHFSPGSFPPELAPRRPGPGRAAISVRSNSCVLSGAMSSKSLVPIFKVIGAALLAIPVLAGIVVLLLLVTAPGARDAEGWTLGPPLPAARGELATAVVQPRACAEPPCPDAELLYVVGGLAGLGSPQDDVAVYDPIARGWREGPPLPEARHHLGATGLGGALYVSGGTDGMLQPWAPRPDFWRLEPGGEWEILTPMPEGRWGHRMVSHDGRLFVVGGQGPTARVLIYDPDDGWTTGAPMPAPRDHLSVVVLDDRIWAIGGRAPESLSRVDIYDPAGDRWEAGPEMPAPTSGAAEGVVNGRVLIYGGEEPTLWGGKVFDRHWMLDSDGAPERWRPAPPPPLPVHGADGTVFQGTLVIAGGASRHGALSVTAWTDAVQRLNGIPLPIAGGLEPQRTGHDYRHASTLQVALRRPGHGRAAISVRSSSCVLTAADDTLSPRRQWRRD
jgi:hypothetical protein